MKDFEYYGKGVLPYPIAPTKPTTDRPTHEFVELLDKYDLDMIRFKESMGEYRKEKDRLETEFKHDALESCGILGHPKADACFSLAYSYGHSAGFSEVYSYLSDLSELLK